MRILPTMIVPIVLVTGAACRSPEATRSRGGGRGADTGNHAKTVRMHEGSYPFWKTPGHIGRTHAPPLGPARQAQELSRR
jgi:hypothetical protein